MADLAAPVLNEAQWNEIIDPVARQNHLAVAPPPSGGEFLERIRQDDMERRIRALENERLSQQR